MKSSNLNGRDLLFVYLRPQWWRVPGLIFLIFAGIGIQLINPQILRYFIDSALGGISVQNLIRAGSLFVGLALIQQLVSIASTYVSENVAWTATNQLRSDLIAHCLRLDLAFHKEKTSGEMLERVDGDVNTLANFFSQAVIQLLGNTLLVSGILVLFFLEDWRIGLTMSLFTLVSFAVLISIRNVATRYWVHYMQASANFMGFLGEHLAGTEDLRANGATGYVMQRFYQLLRPLFESRRKSSLAGYSMWMVTLFLFGLGNALALLIGVYLWNARIISLGTVYITFYYVNLLNDPFEQIRTQLQQLQQAAAAVERVKQLFQAQPTIIEQNIASLPAGALSVSFEEVEFGYQPETPILQQMTFSLPAGQVMGILGRTGSGKTTLARLLLRLYDIQSGSIRLAGVPIQSVSQRELRQHIGMVTQDVQLFHATVRANLTFFDHTISDEHILSVLEEIGLKPWLNALPEGLDTLLGSDGEGLSAGEAQLLAFTRVFLHNPGLVILDEASSRLDPATEQLIERAVSKLFQGRTGIIIAHHLATLQRVDRILYLSDGHILEQGERAELVADPTSHFSLILQTGGEEVMA
ncbi:ABC transporter ATP-binding protein [Tengunoibacter tsumagoiensis]|uniref:Helicase n=1 Tax=Tengunoibacter tsumagoiensis TaxID=2014871 RepID=A0A401ZX69_9CHLR|nr:ABC transporter ATP-binding protein [Tengunoibacter tsumagoiensis]GCE11437.1 helicase [Tengunoibacter tsumagoiensis]